MCCFQEGIPFNFAALGICQWQDLQFHFKTRLGGEICSCDVIMNKGYCINLIFFLSSFGEHLDPQQTQQRPGSAHSSASSQRWKRLSEYSFTYRYMYSTLIYRENLITILLGQMLVLLLQIQQYSWEMASTHDSTHTDRCSWMIIVIMNIVCI